MNNYFVYAGISRHIHLIIINKNILFSGKEVYADMINIKEALPLIINTLIQFHIMYRKAIFDEDVIIKLIDELYIDMSNRIYNEYVNIFHTEELYEIKILYEPNPCCVTYNKLSCDDNILETLSAYIDDIVCNKNKMSYNNIIMSLDCDIPFELPLDITYGWIKTIIDIYK